MSIVRRMKRNRQIQEIHNSWCRKCGNRLVVRKGTAVCKKCGAEYGKVRNRI